MASAKPRSREAAAPQQSRYTSLKDCVDIESGADRGEDWAISRCPGLGRWQLRRDYGDAREYLRVGRAGARGEPDLIASGHYGFNSLGETVEWRGTGKGKEFEPTTLILRNLVSEDPEHSERQTSMLMVVDLAQRCLIGEVRPSPGQNEHARRIADAPDRSCAKEAK